jgi:hypothetical protein
MGDLGTGRFLSIRILHVCETVRFIIMRTNKHGDTEIALHKSECFRRQCTTKQSPEFGNTHVPHSNAHTGCAHNGC